MILKAQNLKKNFHHPQKIEILNDINFEIEENQAIAITGSSGEGKTTLLHILGTLDKPDTGKIEFFGSEIKAKDTPKLRNKHFGFIFQSYNLMDDLSVIDNVLMPARIARKNIHPLSDAYQRAKMLINQIGLEKREHFSAKLLSGGEKQRVAIARALCNDPDLIFADEPSGNLDHENSMIIHELLLSFVKTFHKSLIIVTHDKELARLCDKVFTLKTGKLFQ